MPIVNGKYDAPVWVDNAPPALDATELQAISDSVASYADPFEYVPNLVRPNLLDNWYFVGGGSQQGGGQFPINSKGQTTYTGVANLTPVDKWLMTNSDMTLTVNSGNIQLANASTTSRRAFAQVFKPPTNLYGKTMTGSILLSDGNLYYGSGTFPSSPGSSTSYVVYADFNGNTLRGEIYASGSLQLALMVGANTTVSIVAMKLELGSTQTLAHQENGTWVLNEIPNFDEQFMRCATLPSVPSRIEYGSYVGTGTYGSGNPSSITFGFVPKEVHIRSASDSSTYEFDSVSGMTSTYPSGTITWSGTKMEWYSGASAYQMNTNGTTYYYIAFG